MKTNPDYTKSAINLCNPSEVEKLLRERFMLEQEASLVEEDLRTRGDYLQLLDTKELLAENKKAIEEAVEQYGSYQDIDKGWYAIRQQKVSVTYLPDRVRVEIPLFADAIIEEVVSKPKMEGLVKGGLITEELAKRCAEVSYSEAYIVKIEKGE